MGACGTLVYLHTVEAVQSAVARQTLTLIASWSINTASIGVAVMALQTSLAQTLIYV